MTDWLLDTTNGCWLLVFAWFVGCWCGQGFEDLRRNVRHGKGER